MGSASKGYFTISKESTPGTAITTPTHIYPVEEVNFEWENEMQDIHLIQGSRQAYTSFDGAIRPTASIMGPFYPSGAAGAILYGLFGAKAAALEGLSTTAYTHNFTDGAALPYFTLERADAFSGAGGLLCERVAGAKVEGVTLKAAFGEKVDFGATFQAMKKPTNPSPIASGALTYPVEAPLIFKGASLEVDDVANTDFKSINIEIKNNLVRQEGLNGTQEAVSILEGSLDCTVSAAMRFESMAMYNKCLNGTEFKLELILVSSTIADAVTTPDIYYGAKLTWDIMRVSKFSNPFRAGDVIEADATFKVLYNKTNSRSVLWQMTNLDATTVYDT